MTTHKATAKEEIKDLKADLKEARADAREAHKGGGDVASLRKALHEAADRLHFLGYPQDAHNFRQAAGSST